jgi:hypothetical protein
VPRTMSPSKTARLPTTAYWTTLFVNVSPETYPVRTSVLVSIPAVSRRVCSLLSIPETSDMLLTSPRWSSLHCPHGDLYAGGVGA